MLQNVFDRFTTITSASGWRRNAAAFGFGVTGTLAMPPVFIFLLLMLSFSGLFRLIETAPNEKRVFLDGWWWGWGFHISGLYWFTLALLTEPEKFAWLIPFALFGLTAIIALYPAIACWLTAKTKTHGLVKIFVFSVIWTLVEYARAHLFSGFPWNMIGYSMGFSKDTLQLASVVGIYGLTWFAVLFGTLPAALDDSRIKHSHAGMAVFSACLVLIFAADWGNLRLRNADKHPEETQYVEQVRLRLVQANIQQHHKWDPALQLAGLEEHIRLSLSPGIESVTHIVWPETAVPYAMKPYTPLTRLLAGNTGKARLLITGALRVEGKGEDWKLYNSIVVLGHHGGIVDSYDKAKLVPFGEFLPLRFLLPKFLTTPVGEHDFSRGPGPRTLTWPGLPPVSPLVCYEVIFPERAVDKNERPYWLLNVTNDAWFGISSGPHQHFHMARMRAAEQGIPLVRVANTGITAVTDRYGRILASLKLGTQGVLDVKLPTRQNSPTIYAKYGDRLLLPLLFLGIILIIWQRKPKKD